MTRRSNGRRSLTRRSLPDAYACTPPTSAVRHPVGPKSVDELNRPFVWSSGRAGELEELVSSSYDPMGRSSHNASFVRS